jgi:hypothetical protein
MVAVPPLQIVEEIILKVGVGFTKTCTVAFVEHPKVVPVTVYTAVLGGLNVTEFELAVVLQE